MMWVCWAIGSIISYIVGIKLIRRLSWQQQIYEDSPKSHQQKQGTPTMGGILIFFGFISGAIMLDQWNLTTIWVVVTRVYFV